MFITLSGIGEYHATMVPALMICGSSVVLVIHTGIVFVLVCLSTIPSTGNKTASSWDCSSSIRPVVDVPSRLSECVAIIDIVHGSSVTSCLTSKE